MSSASSGFSNHVSNSSSWLVGSTDTSHVIWGNGASILAGLDRESGFHESTGSPSGRLGLPLEMKPCRSFGVAC